LKNIFENKRKLCDPSFHGRIQMLHRILFALLAFVGPLHAHNVPSITIESQFTADETFDLTIHFDPRIFLAADPRTLPPVDGTWFSNQSPDQASATLIKADEYLRKSLGLVFNGRPIPLPKLTIQPVDGADNTPLSPDTQELHFLAQCAARIPKEATEFQVVFAKSAAVDLILLNTLENTADRRPQVLFPGETSRPFLFRHTLRSAPIATEASPPVPASPSVTLLIALVAVFVGWRLLKKYRHFHRGHRKPKDWDI
jgi:hypothetical protein